MMIPTKLKTFDLKTFNKPNLDLNRAMLHWTLIQLEPSYNENYENKY
jgi:hypothetical protein